MPFADLPKYEADLHFVRDVLQEYKTENSFTGHFLSKSDKFPASIAKSNKQCVDLLVIQEDG